MRAFDEALLLCWGRLGRWHTEHYEVGLEGHSCCLHMVLLPLEWVVIGRELRFDSWAPLESNLSVALRVACKSDELGAPWTITVWSGKVGVQPGRFFTDHKELMTAESLQEAEVLHMQQNVALRAFKSLGRRSQTGHRRRRRRGGRGRGRGRGAAARGDGSGISETASDDDNSDTVEESSEELLDEAPKKKTVSDRAGRGERGTPWGPFLISSGPWGVGATCGMHINKSRGGCNLKCKKQVTFGESGFSEAAMITRMKRWLLAGLDDDLWETDEKRSRHISMGGRFLKDFAEGMTDEQMDIVVRAL